MNKIPKIRQFAFVLVIGLAACTRPASLPFKTGTPTPLFQETGTLVSTKASTTQVREEAKTTVPTSTVAAQKSLQANGSPPSAKVPITQILMEGPVTSKEAEISGMAWYDDKLILLPQYPNHFPLKGVGSVFVLQRSEILDYLQGKASDPLSPVQVPFIAPNLDSIIKGFEGFEAIAVEGDRVYLTVEASPGGMMGYLVAGQIAPGLSQIRLDTSKLTPIPPQTTLPNFSDEALLVFGSRLVSIYEISGAPFNPNPVAHLFDFSLQLQDTLAFPNIPYRISDATSPDEYGRFWTINFATLDEEATPPATDSLANILKEVLSKFKTIERLVEFQFSEEGIVLSETPPILIQTIDQQDYNWEGIVRLEGYGFLLVTDHDPETFLGFVPYP